MNDLTHLSLFTGIGGIDLAAEWAGFRTVGQVEINSYCLAVLEKHWPGIPRWEDVRHVTARSFREKTKERAPFLLSGGFPCQPVSYAGKRRGTEDDRWLWPEMLRIVRELRPTWIIGENVPGLINLGLDDILADLEHQEYEVRAFLIPALAVGAWHQRERIFIIAYAGYGHQLTNSWDELQKNLSEKPIPSSSGQLYSLTSADIHISRRASGGQDRGIGGIRESFQISDSNIIPNSNGEYGEKLLERNQLRKEGKKMPFRWKNMGIGRIWDAEPRMGRVANGVPHRVDRLRCLGNAVVPQQVYPIFEAIAEIEGECELTR